MGNGIAYAVLVIFPLYAIRTFQVKSVQKASLWVILIGFMFLPVRTEIDLPFVPPLDKRSIPVVSIILGCWLVKRIKVRIFSNKGFLKVLVILLFFVPFITAELNGESVNIGGRFLPGLSYYDALSIVINQLLFFTPFFVGRQFFRSYEDQLLLFKTLMLAGLFYSIFVLFEVRMSPQLHKWIYGYFPHSFAQQKRFGGFRPVVFMGHGLWVANYCALVFLSSAILLKNKEKVITGVSTAFLSGYLFVVLALCKGVAALLYGMFAFVMIRMAGFRLQMYAAMALVCLALLYPSLSILKIFPHKEIVEQVYSISPERAQSLSFRFENEEILLDHGRRKFFFGWGGWGRNRVHNEETGVDLSVTDGRWVLTFGQYGWLGFIAEFGIYAFVVFRARSAQKYIKSKNDNGLLTAHAVLVGIVAIDQLPNASLEPWILLIIGALLGRSEDILLHNKGGRKSMVPTGEMQAYSK